MADEKNPPPKGPDRRSAESRGSGPKRPYSTLDLKATEVSPKSPSDKDAATPKSEVPPPPKGQDAGPAGSQAAAAARIAAASAGMRRPDGSSATESAGIKASGAGGAAGAHASSTSSASGRSGWGSYVSHLAAGLAGGVLAIVGSSFTALPPQGPGEGSSATAVQELGRRLAAVERSTKERADQLQSVENSVSRLDEVSRKVDALGADQARLADGLKQAEGRQGADAATANRIAKLEDQLSTIAAAAAKNPEGAGPIPQLAQIMGKLNELESSTAERLAGLRKDMSQLVETRVASVAEASEAAKSGATRLDREVAGVRSDIARLGQRVDTMRAASDRLEQSVRGLQAETAAAKAAFETFKSDVQNQLQSTAKPGDVSTAVAPVAAKIATLEKSVQNVVQSEEQRKVNAERIVLSLELSDLKRAMDRGGPYAAELASVKRISQGRVDLAALERYENEGVPTQAELVRSFQSVANAALDADADKPDASVMDRLLSGARSIVRVRKITHAADDQSTEAVIGRMETALKENRLGDVLEESKKLSARAAVPIEPWLRKVEARQAVDTAIAAIDAELKASVAARKGGTQ